MQKAFLFLLTVFFSFVFSSCYEGRKLKNTADELPLLNPDSIAKHIAVLSSDDFAGRKPFTIGEQKTLAYLVQQFSRLGLSPGNGISYYQDVPMVKITSSVSPQMEVTSPAGKILLNGPQDFVLWTDKTDSALSFDKTEVVFAGYGVVAPEHNWNDYANLDVKGKVVLVLVNDPGFNAGDTSLFKGKAMTWYGRWPYKYAEAAKQGAKGCLIIHSTAAASYPFSVVQNNWNTSKLHLDNRGKTEQYCDMVGWISSEAADKLLRAAGKDSSLLRAADKRGFRGESLKISVAASMKASSTYDVSHNVIAAIPGSKYSDETIIYSAHWDHLGIGAPDEKGDSVYNGALDNGSGTAALIEMARAFQTSKQKPERTIVFLAVTAEEQGLWGSDYYAQHPVYPIKKTVANLNMDVLNWFGKTKDIVVVGQGQNELEDYLKDELIKTNREMQFDKHPESGSYYRSDHFSFAKVGVPSMDLKYGSDVIGKEAGHGAWMAKEYVDKNYHRPSDEFNPAVWDLRGAAADAGLLFRIGYRLAFERRFPAWKPGSEFKAIREK